MDDVVVSPTTSFWGWWILAVGFVLMTVGVILVLRRPPQQTATTETPNPKPPEVKPNSTIQTIPEAMTPLGVPVAPLIGIGAVLALLAKSGLGGALIALGVLLQLGGIVMLGGPLVFNTDTLEQILRDDGGSTTTTTSTPVGGG